MTINELKNVLDNLDKKGYGDLEAVLSIDEEGNGFKTVYEVQINNFYRDEPVAQEDIDDGEYETKDLVEKAIIWP